MILAILLTIIMLVLLVISVAAIVAGGAGFIIIFGDVIVCAFIIAWIVKKLVNRKRR